MHALQIATVWVSYSLFPPSKLHTHKCCCHSSFCFMIWFQLVSGEFWSSSGHHNFMIPRMSLALPTVTLQPMSIPKWNIHSLLVSFCVSILVSPPSYFLDNILSFIHLPSLTTFHDNYSVPSNDTTQTANVIIYVCALLSFTSFMQCPWHETEA